MSETFSDRLSDPISPAAAPDGVLPTDVPVSDDDAVSAAFRALRRLLSAGDHYRTAAAEQFGVGETEVLAMRYLDSGELPTATDLSARLGLTKSAITAVIDRLEAAGLAERFPHPSDRRRTLIALTDLGRARTQWAQASIRKALADLAPARLAALTSDMDDLATHMQRQADQLGD